MNREQSPGLGPRHDAATRVQKPDSAVDRMAALKARVAAAVGGSKAVGLNTPLHPALAELNAPSKPGDSSGLSSPASGRRPGTDTSRSAVSSFKKRPPDGSGDGAADQARSNPYLDPGSGPSSGGGKTREPRQLIFNQKGKYIQQGNVLRRQARLEEMKKRISEQTQRAGIDDDLDAEKTLVFDEPPSIEWWDEGLVDGDTYDAPLKITTPGSIVTLFIQHPVAINPPQDKQAPEPKPMYLTPKEQKKLRRQRRMMELKETQAKIRLGLVPTPAPKVKQSNLMRVLGEEAVKDPTKVEARVNQAIAERKQKHEEANGERKLTKEARLEKLATNQAKDAAQGIHMLVFKINSLANGQHRYKVNINADQNALTGVVILHPRQNLVIAEGGKHSISSFKKLMTKRINWTESLPSRERDSAQGSAVREWLKAEDQSGNLKDLSANTCTLLFEGETKAQVFKKFGNKVCETEAEVKEFLSQRKLENFWTQAKAAQ